jgi:hypothetical protein
MVVSGLFPSWLSAWLTPIWLLGVGALAGLIILVILWGVLWLVSRRAAREIPSAVGEGVLLPILIVTAALALFGLVGTALVQAPGNHIYSLRRVVLFSAGSETRQYTIPAATRAGGELKPHEIDVDFHGDELRELRLASPQNLVVTTPPRGSAKPAQLWAITGGEELRWVRGEQEASPLWGEQFDRLLVYNDRDTETTLQLTITTQPIYPEIATVPITAICVVAVFLLYLGGRVSMPKVSAIALATAKSEMSQPLFAILLVAGFCLLLLFLYLPYFTFDEDIKVFKDSGLTLIMILCILQAVWAASTSVSEELEGRTALTVLSKPIGRRQFILGKFSGIVWTVAVMFTILGVLFLVLVAYKPIFDARETAEAEPTWQLCHLEMVQIVPGLVLGFLETVVLASISVAVSTWLPMLANFLICAFIYAAGHLTPLIVQSSLGRFEPVQFVGQLVATVFPVLDHFSVQAAVSSGVPVGWEYLAVASLYAALYSTAALLLALALFEHRDLA